MTGTSETVQAILAEAERRGVVLVPEGDFIRCRGPRGALTPDLLAALRARKLEILAALRSQPQPHAEPCYDCRRVAWWRSVHGAVVCGRCHPPATLRLVREWVWVGMGGEQDS